MSEQPGLKSVPVGMSPLGQYFVGRLLMLRECLSYEQWSSFERSADVICDSFLKRMSYGGNWVTRPSGGAL